VALNEHVNVSFLLQLCWQKMSWLERSITAKVGKVAVRAVKSDHLLEKVRDSWSF